LTYITTQQQQSAVSGTRVNVHINIMCKYYISATNYTNTAGTKHREYVGNKFKLILQLNTCS